ncbi:hypothetical protein QBC39DRAFT_350953 [Podospora conica]|nr:hypothetical protein QBC39DRAFT_350953 [Schizothecium conicum]
MAFQEFHLALFIVCWQSRTRNNSSLRRPPTMEFARGMLDGKVDDMTSCPIGHCINPRGAGCWPCHPFHALLTAYSGLLSSGLAPLLFNPLA